MAAKARLGVTGLPPSDSFGSLALLMASTVAYFLALDKRGSAILVRKSNFGVLSRASAANLERFILSSIQARLAEEATAEKQTGEETAAAYKEMSRNGNFAYLAVCHPTIGIRFVWMWWREAGYRTEVLEDFRTGGCQTAFEEYDDFFAGTAPSGYGSYFTEDMISFGERIFPASDM